MVKRKSVSFKVGDKVRVKHGVEDVGYLFRAEEEAGYRKREASGPAITETA